MGALTPALKQKLTNTSSPSNHSVPYVHSVHSTHSIHSEKTAPFLPSTHSTQSVQFPPSIKSMTSVHPVLPSPIPLRRTQSLDPKTSPPKPTARILGIPYSSVEEKYVLGRQLGKSIGGIVRRCICRTTGEPFACKTLLKSRMTRASDIADVRAEVRALGKLRGNPNVAGIRGVVEDEECVHIITEACDGGDLFLHLKQKRFREPDCASMCKTLLSVIDYCHQLGIMHRNLKPETVWMATTDTESDIKITDFGQVAFFTKGTKLTDAVGTPYYVAPEVLNRSYGPEADIWSLGCILYILLCGVPPFWAEKREAIFLKIREGVVDTEHGVWQNISKEAKDLVKKMLCVNVSKRITAKEAQEHPWILQNCYQLIETDTRQIYSSEEIPLVNPIENSSSPSPYSSPSPSTLPNPQNPSLPLPHNSSSPTLTIRTRPNSTNFSNISNSNILNSNYLSSRGSPTEESSPSAIPLPQSRPLVSSRSISPSSRCSSLSLLENVQKPPTNPKNPPSFPPSVNPSLPPIKASLSNPPHSHHSLSPPSRQNSRSQSPSPKSPFSDQKTENLLPLPSEKNLGFSPRGLPPSSLLPPRSNSFTSLRPVTRQYGIPLCSPQISVEEFEYSSYDNNNNNNNDNHNHNDNSNNSNHFNSNNQNYSNSNTNNGSNNNKGSLKHHDSNNNNYQIPKNNNVINQNPSQNSNSNRQIPQNPNNNHQVSNNYHQISYNNSQISNNNHQISNNNSQNSHNNYQISATSANLQSLHFSTVSRSSSGTSSPSSSTFLPSPSFSNTMENGGLLSPLKSPLRTVISCKGDSGTYSIDFHGIQVVVDYDKLEEVIGITVLPIN